MGGARLYTIGLNHKKQVFRAMMLLLTAAMLGSALSGCYFFRKRGAGGEDGADDPSRVLGRPIGNKAGELNEAALALVHGVTSDRAPAAIRPDPDIYVRNLLLQYREEGVTVAREIGRVERYRLLMGGASEDFSTPPQLTYDATSMLAAYKVAEELCRGLVAPNTNMHGNWESILPYNPGDARLNVRFLAQRFTGLPSEQLSEQALAELEDIYALAAEETGFNNYEAYIPVCAALAIDAEAMLL